MDDLGWWEQMTPKKVAPIPIMDDGVKWTDSAITLVMEIKMLSPSR